MPTQTRLPKLHRDPERVAAKRITARSLEIIALIVRYRFLPTSFIVRLIAGDPDTTQAHLKLLYHAGLISRFAFPKIRGNLGEFFYVVDNADALRLLADNNMLVDPYDFEIVRNNREKSYGKLLESADVEERVGKLLFLKHECMISRFHAMVELACKHSEGRIELCRWEQGSHLYSTVKVDTGRAVVKLPHRPDAMFSLRFTDRLEGQNESHFLYEADRKTTSAERMKDKLKSHLHYVIKQKLHIQKLGSRA